MKNITWKTLALGVGVTSLLFTSGCSLFPTEEDYHQTVIKATEEGSYYEYATVTKGDIHVTANTTLSC